MSGRIISLAIGNSTVAAGLFDPAGKLRSIVKRNTASFTAANDFTALLTELIPPSDENPAAEGVSICSVVPRLDMIAAEASRSFFGSEPFVCSKDSNSGLEMDYATPQTLGMDRVAACSAAHSLYPGRNLVVVDMGTATTVNAVTRDGVFKGGAIMPGMLTSAKYLSQATSKLPEIDVHRPDRACGRSTEECMRSGIFYGHLGAVSTLVSRVAKDSFGSEGYFVVATGGASKYLMDEKIFDAHEENLVLEGARLIFLSSVSCAERTREGAI